VPFKWSAASPQWSTQLAVRQLSELLQSLLPIHEGQEMAVDNAIAILVSSLDRFGKLWPSGQPCFWAATRSSAMHDCV
jgi:hypothetical protein